MKKIFFTILFIISTTKLMAQTDVFKYSGTIGNKPIVLLFYLPSHWYCYDYGEYYYATDKKKIKFKGSSPEGNDSIPQKLYEIKNGKKTGYFIFNSSDYFLMDKFEEKTMTGKWYSTDGKISYNVFLKRMKILHE